MSSILDDWKGMADIDNERMLKIAECFPEQCEDAINLSKTLKIPDLVKISKRLLIKYRKPSNIVIVGMGGSAIGGHILKDWLRTTLPVPIEVCRSYHLPAYANGKTLVLTVSYSGNTEETLNAYFEAIEKKCMIVAVTSGGLLQELSEEIGVPLLRVPRGYPPRSAIAYLFFPLVSSLEKLELINPTEEVGEVVEVVTKLRDEIKPETPSLLNLSKKLAIGLKGSIPYVCGFNQYEGVALRIKTQLNENSKILSKIEVFPEFSHNEVVGWTEFRNMTKAFSVILIRDDKEEGEIKTRLDETRKLIFDQRAKNILEIRVRGESRLARIFSAIYIGDFTSLYLAILYQIDPAPVAIIDEFKRRIQKKVDKRKELQERVRTLKDC